MKYLFAILISLMSIAPISASHRLYNETGALPSTLEDWERVGVPLFSSSRAVERGNRLSCGILQLGTFRLSEFPKLPDASPEILMSEVKDQGCEHGFCTAFAVCACAEAITGKVFSESELILRLKTERGDDKTCDGSYLYLYPMLLRCGLVLNEDFPKYDAFELYIQIRKNQSDPKKHNPAFPLLESSERFCGNSEDYQDAITSFKSWCKKANKPMPITMRPSWGHAVISAKNYKGDLVRKYPQFQREFKERPHIGFTVMLLDAHSYYEASFKMERIAVFEPHHPSGDPLHSLKIKLLQKTPIALCIKTFAKYKFDADGKRVIEKTWLGTAPKLENNYKIDAPPSEYERYGGHALCLCGYDDSKGAFRIKNSWSTTWADKGYAWLSYDYVAQHAFMDDAFSIELDRR